MEGPAFKALIAESTLPAEREKVFSLAYLGFNLGFAFGAAMVGGAVLGPLGAVMALPASAMIQALASSWGTRHEVIDDDGFMQARI